MTWRVTCPKCAFEETVDSLEEVEEAHQQSEWLNHVVEFERVSDATD